MVSEPLGSRGAQWFAQCEMMTCEKAFAFSLGRRSHSSRARVIGVMSTSQWASSRSCLTNALSIVARRLWQHNTKRHIANVQLMGNLQRLPNIIAILHEGLGRQIRIEAFDKAFTLATTVDNHSIRTRSFGNGHTLTDRVDKGFFREWFDNARNTDNGDTALDTKTRIEGTTGNLFTLRNEYRDVQRRMFILQIISRGALLMAGEPGG